MMNANTSNTWRRRTGLEPPYSTLQKCTWILFPLYLIDFACFNVPSLIHSNSGISLTIPLAVFYYVSAFWSVYYGYKTCVTDSIDPLLEAFLNNAHDNNNASNNDGGGCKRCKDEDDVEDLRHCWVCNLNVKPTSLHCKFCQKCVANFDHHCQWLNTCIGERNYHLFFRTVVSTFVMLCVHTIVNGYLVIAYFADVDGMKSSMDDSYLGGIAMIIFICLFFGLSVGANAAVTQLLVFHLSLKKQNITTYQYIVNYNKISLEKKRNKRQMRLKREEAIKNATRGGKSVTAFRLKIGAYCTLCDPLTSMSKSTKSVDPHVGEIDACENGNTLSKISLDKIAAQNGSAYSNSTVQEAGLGEEMKISAENVNGVEEYSNGQEKESNGIMFIRTQKDSI